MLLSLQLIGLGGTIVRVLVWARVWTFALTGAVCLVLSPMVMTSAPRGLIAIDLASAIRRCTLKILLRFTSCWTMGCMNNLNLMKVVAGLFGSVTNGMPDAFNDLAFRICLGLKVI